MPSALLISNSILNWNTFLNITKTLLGRNLTSELDSKQIPIDTIAGTVALLGQFQCQGTNPTATIRNPGSIARHVMMTFLVTGDKELIYEVLMHSNISILDCEQDKMYIMSANLEDWRGAIINFASVQYSNRLREFSYVLITRFDQMGLERLFEDYSRKVVRDSLTLYKKD